MTKLKSRHITIAITALLLLGACSAKEEEASRSLLREKDRDVVLATAEEMTGVARLIFFTSQEDCEYCSLTEGFLGDIASLTDKISLEVIDRDRDAGGAAAYGIDRVPATAILGDKDYGIRYYGLPTGYEFVAFVEAIGKAANNTSGLAEETVASLAGLTRPVMVTVFSTKT